jgi:hypothetical protein
VPELPVPWSGSGFDHGDPYRPGVVDTSRRTSPSALVLVGGQGLCHVDRVDATTSVFSLAAPRVSVVGLGKSIGINSRGA